MLARTDTDKTPRAAIAGLPERLRVIWRRMQGRLFRKYAALLVALVASALAVTSGVESYYSYREHHTSLVAIQREKAQGAATVIEQFLKEIEGQLGWATHLGLGAGQASEEQGRIDLLRLLRQAPAITEVAKLDGQGREQLRVSRLAMDQTASGIDRSGEPAFQVALEKRRYISPVYFRKESEPYLTMAVTGASRRAGVTIAEVNLKFIWDVISRIKAGSAGLAYAVDNRGLLIAHPDIGLVLRKTDLSDLSQVAAAQSGPSTESTPAVARNRTGEDVLTAHARVDAVGWHVFVEQPLAEAFAPVYASLLRTGGLALLGLALAAAAGLWLAQRMVVPIEALATGAARIGAGDLDHEITVRTGDEVEALAGDFNEMRARLRESYAGLERKVEVRTAELQETLQYQTATSEVLGVISRSPSKLKPVLDAIVNTAARLCSAEYAFIAKTEGGACHLVAGNNMAAEHLRYLADRPVAIDRSSITGRVALTSETIHVADVLADPEFTQLEWQKAGRQRTVLGVPLTGDGVLIGVIILARTDVSPFSERQIDLVTTFADQAVIAINNVELFEEVQTRTMELQETLEYQTATGEVLGVISRSPSQIQPVLDQIVLTAAQLCGAHHATIFTLGQDGLYHVAAADRADAVLVQHLRANPIAPGRGTVIGRTALERRTVHIPDVLADPEYVSFETQRLGNIRTLLGVPLLRNGEPIGVISTVRTTVQPFTDKQIELVKTFADQAVIAIENARLFEAEQTRTKELKESLEYQTAISDVLDVISRSPNDVQPVLDAIVATARQLCEADYAHCRIERGGLYHVTARSYLDADRVHHPGAPVAIDRSSLTGRVVLDRCTIHVPDILEDPEDTYARSVGVPARSVLGVPLIRDVEIVGVIGLFRKAVRPFTQRQIDLVTTFANQAVIAIENARLFEAEQTRTKELQESLEYQTATSNVLGVISRSPSEIQPVLESIVSTAAGLCDGFDATILLRRGEDLHVGAHHGAIPLDFDVKKITPHWITGRAVLERQAVHVHDFADAKDEYPEGFELHQRQGHRTGLAIPLLRESDAIGAFMIRRLAVNPFTQKQIAVLQTFADQAVIAIENARLFREIGEKSRQLEIASLHKSQFLANMSHELRTPLNAILGYTELIQDGVYGEPQPKIAGVLDRVQSNGRHLLGLINDVLDISKIEAGQLVLQLEDYAMTGVVETVIAATESLAAEKKLAMTSSLPKGLPTGRGDVRRLTQVLLNLVGNAIKFTDRGTVTVAAKVKKSRFVLTVTDTGPGIPEAEQERIFEEFHQVDSSNTKRKGGTGLGLAISRRIIALHGGRISVQSRPGEGATFQVELPIRVERQKGFGA